MTTTTPTRHPECEVPALHRCTNVDADGSLWLYGFRAWDTTARYTIIHDGWRNGDGTDVIAENVTWGTAWRRLVERGWGTRLPDLLRAVLP